MSELHNDYVNTAEPTIKMAKYHMIAGLSTIDKSCLLQLWDKFVPQIQSMLNMLQTLHSNSSISVFEELEGPFNFNKTPFTPIGTKVSLSSDPMTGQVGHHMIWCFLHWSRPASFQSCGIFNPETHSFLIMGTYKLHTLHYKCPPSPRVTKQ